MEENPTARALRCLEVLQGRAGVTAEQLAMSLGVSERAARRYVELLRAAGVPIESTRGRYGGYRLGRGMRLPPLTFSAAEALGLVMAVLDGHHEVRDSADPVGAAMAKLVRSLPAEVARQVEAVRTTAAAAPDRAAVRPDPDTTIALVQACADRRRVRLAYLTAGGSDRQITAEPWAVVVRHGRWYLLGRAVRAGAVRAYRVDRVRSVDVLTIGFAPPADLDAVASLETHLAAGWDFPVEVVIDAAIDEVRDQVPPVLGVLTPIDASSCRLVGSTSAPRRYVERLALVRAPYRVVRGPEVQAMVRELGQRLLAAAP